MMTLVTEVWFSTTSGTVGIVVGEDSFTHERKAYIGIVSGISMEQDRHYLLEHGSPFPLGGALTIVNALQHKKLRPAREKRKGLG